MINLAASILLLHMPEISADIHERGNFSKLAPLVEPSIPIVFLTEHIAYLLQILN